MVEVLKMIEVLMLNSVHQFYKKPQLKVKAICFIMLLKHRICNFHCKEAPYQNKTQDICRVLSEGAAAQLVRASWGVVGLARPEE